MQNEMIAYMSFAHVPQTFGYHEEVISEDANGVKKKKLILEGEFQQANITNRNNRMYTESLLARETKKLSSIIESRGGRPMELDHPLPGIEKKDLIKAQRVSLERACALCTHLEMNGNIVYGKSEVVEENQYGATLGGLVRRNWKPGVSSRGLGGKPLQTAQGFLMVPEDYNMVTYDYVSDPSNYNSILETIVEEQMLMIQQNERPSYRGRKLWSVLEDIYNERV